MGSALLERSSPQPLFARWIETYGGDEFGAIVSSVLEVVDDIGTTASAAQVTAMRTHVLTTSRYEWMFWNAAWRGEVWPV